jgi:glyoxylase I family protein
MAAALQPIDHLDLVVSDLERSLPFYRGLLGPLGYERESTIEGERGERVIYLSCPRPGGSVGLRQRPPATHPAPHDRYAVGVHHIAFAAASRAVVDERVDWARAHGAEVESEPRDYAYSHGYYAGFFYDPDGIKLEIVHTPD